MENIAVELWHLFYVGAGLLLKHIGDVGWKTYRNKKGVCSRNGDTEKRVEYITRPDFTEFKKSINERIDKVETANNERYGGLDKKLDEVIVKLAVIIDRSDRK